MKYFSSFSGIGGFELGIQQAYENKRIKKQDTISQGRQKKVRDTRNGYNETKWNLRYSRQSSQECVGFSEIDKYAIQIYQKHFPTHKNYGDITKIVASEIPDHDLFVGGFPCQSFSIAGKRGGFKDTRGTLFFDIARIIKVKRPKNFVLENVKGLLSHDKGNTFATIISTIDELGYDCQWQVLNSKNFGVPQNRERVFIVGHLRGTSRPKVFPIREGNENFNKRNKKRKKQIADTITGRYGKRNARGTHIADFRNDEGLRIRKEFISPNLTTRRHSETDISTMPPLVLSRSRYKYNEVREVRGNPTLRSISGQTLIGKDTEIRRLTPIECERLQGFPDDWTEGVSDTQRYKTLGNAVTVNVVREIMKKLFYYN